MRRQSFGKGTVIVIAAVSAATAAISAATAAVVTLKGKVPFIAKAKKE